MIGVFGSLIGAFGLAAIGAENDPTANLSAAVMFIAVPVVISILAILGAFEVLSVIYIDKSSELFVAVAGAGGLFGMVFNAFSIADSPGHHPTSFTATELNNRRNRQWLATRAEAYKAMKLIIVSTGLPTLVGIVVRLCGVGVTISVMASNWIIGVGILLCLAGTVLCLTRSMHPESGNEQVGLRAWEAWATNIVIGLYTLLIVFVLP